MATLDDHIAAKLRESASSGELQSAPSFGKPLDFGDGYFETPEELRMGFKVLKDAGFVPPEVEMLHQVAALQSQLEATTDDAEAAPLRQRISELRQHIALRLEKLRATGSL